MVDREVIVCERVWRASVLEEGSLLTICTAMLFALTIVEVPCLEGERKRTLDF